MFPQHISEVLDRFGVAPDTKAVLYDLYVSMGSGVLESFADLCEGRASLADVRPEDVGSLRQAIVQNYLRRNHPRWLELEPTASLWHPRALEGRAAGLAVPLGRIGTPTEGFGQQVDQLARQILGAAQPVPEGMLMLGKNAHSGGRSETISFDVVAVELADALEIAQASGQQHTLPGSIGETSGTIDAGRSLALLWEIQPNVLKPSGERNRRIRHLYRRHRNWHVITLLVALIWLRGKRVTTFVVQGRALPSTHEVNPAKPVSATVMALHDRTVKLVVEALGGFVVPLSADETTSLLETELMNTGLRDHVSELGAGDAVWRVILDQNSGPGHFC